MLCSVLNGFKSSYILGLRFNKSYQVCELWTGRYARLGTVLNFRVLFVYWLQLE
jgi:hypothetical protein